ncbi:hypothetical protein ABEB36_000018 [Hypothenemus hampei]|uniref:Uncharacterized protein n=1 Tax=Hypothenemus hampei TaxID=57062 RepID=A0ABD1FA03_HYPHA
MFRCQNNIEIKISQETTDVNNKKKDSRRDPESFHISIEKGPIIFHRETENPSCKPQKRANNQSCHLKANLHGSKCGK